MRAIVSREKIVFFLSSYIFYLFRFTQVLNKYMQIHGCSIWNIIWPDPRTFFYHVTWTSTELLNPKISHLFCIVCSNTNTHILGINLKICRLYYTLPPWCDLESFFIISIRWSCLWNLPTEAPKRIGQHPCGDLKCEASSKKMGRKRGSLMKHDAIWFILF
jgi:hypothetical protein